MIYVHSYAHVGNTFSPEKNYRMLDTPDYSAYFEKNEMRRLSLLIRNATGCALAAVEGIYPQEIQGIITGTGKGSISKIEQFLADISKYGETALNPAVFIQSTHNTISGQIALKLGIEAYNMTHVNQGHTIYNVLKDVELMLLEKPGARILFGFFEENTPFNITIHGDAGYNGRSDHDRVTWGEGVSFFTAGAHAEGSSACISDYRMFHDKDLHAAAVTASSYLQAACTGKKCRLLAGYCNSRDKEEIYKPVLEAAQKLSAEVIPFKDLYGEFDTASGNALSHAIELLVSNQAERVIICNHFKNTGLHIIIVTKP